MNVVCTCTMVVLTCINGIMVALTKADGNFIPAVVNIKEATLQYMYMYMYMDYMYIYELLYSTAVNDCTSVYMYIYMQITLTVDFSSNRYNSWSAMHGFILLFTWRIRECHGLFVFHQGYYQHTHCITTSIQERYCFTQGFFFNDDNFNFNYAQTKAMLGSYAEAEEVNEWLYVV